MTRKPRSEMPFLGAATTTPARTAVGALVSVLVTAHCGFPSTLSAQDAPLPDDFPLQVTGVRTVDPDEGFGRMLDGTLDATGNAYIVDFDSRQLIAIAPDATIRFRHGREGSGPGEYRLLYRAATAPDGTIHLLDFGSNEISRVRPDGEFVDRRRLDLRLRTIHSMLVDSSGRVILSGIAPYDEEARDAAIHVFDSTLAHRRSFGPLPEAEDPDVLNYWGAGGISWAGDGEVLFARRLPYEIHRFSLDGNHLQVIEAPFTYELGPDDAVSIVESGGRRKISRSKNDVPNILPAQPLSATGYILGGRGIGETTWWDVFTKDGTLVASAEVPDEWGGVLGYDEARERLWVWGERALEPVVFIMDVEIQ